jgi:DNA polymerase III epsilon subunit-like protein
MDAVLRYNRGRRWRNENGRAQGKTSARRVSHLGDRRGGEVTDKVVEPAKRATVCIKLTTRAEVASEQNAMREIVLDTETTGLDPLSGHRVVGPA